MEKFPLLGMEVARSKVAARPQETRSSVVDANSFDHEWLQFFSIKKKNLVIAKKFNCVKFNEVKIKRIGFIYIILKILNKNKILNSK